MNYSLGKFLRFFVEKLIHWLEPRAVLDKRKYAWSALVEKAHPEIKKEAQKVLGRVSEIVNFNDVIPGQRALYQNEKWKSYFLVGLGKDVEKHQAQCPATSEALKKIPGVMNAFFSILAPGVEIPSHRGPYAGILRYHLGVIVPRGDVGIKVNGELCRWEEGASLFFDDSFLHEAWNRTEEIRVVLFVDLVRPLPVGLSLLNRLVLFAFEKSKAAQDAKAKVTQTQVDVQT